MNYQIKPRGIIEFVVTVLLFLKIPFSLAVLFLFKSSTKAEQRVAIPPSRLIWAKIIMFLTLGTWWFWLRYWADRCPECGCVWYRKHITTNEIDSYTEPYTYNKKVRTRFFQTTKYAWRQEVPGMESVTTVQQTGYRKISVQEDHYACANCGHEESRIQNRQV